MNDTLYIETPEMPDGLKTELNTIQEALLKIDFQINDDDKTDFYIYVLNDLYDMKLEYEKTTEYFHEVTDSLDFRYLANGKKDVTNLTPYTQVFGEKHGFINNLSVLDLLFNEGRFALDYLKEQTL